MFEKRALYWPQCLPLEVSWHFIFHLKLNGQNNTTVKKIKIIAVVVCIIQQPTKYSNIIYNVICFFLCFVVQNGINSKNLESESDEVNKSKITDDELLYL